MKAPPSGLVPNRFGPNLQGFSLKANFGILYIVPAKNSIKEYEPGAFYHIYNRGVEKRDIFLDPQDYKVVISYLATYLSPPSPQGFSLKAISPSHTPKNYFEQICLLCFCLMPNHFHLLIKQSEISGMNYFMRSIATRYSVYFNKKYHRVGSLFQGTYKAIKITSDQQLLHLSRYIHLNPSKLYQDLPPSRRNLEVLQYPYSSLGHYLHHYTQSWISADLVLNNFHRDSPNNSYKSFLFSSPMMQLANDLTLESDTDTFKEKP